MAIITQQAKNAALAKAKKLIPFYWNELYVILAGIESGDITPDDDTETARSLSGSLASILDGISFESYYHIQAFPVKVLKLRDHWGFVKELETAICAIEAMLNKVKPILVTFSEETNGFFHRLEQQCAVIKEMLDWYWGKDYSNHFDYFTPKRCHSLFKIVSGDNSIILPISYQDFSNILNCKMGSDKSSVNSPVVKIRPRKGFEMAFYVFITVLMLDRDDEWNELRYLLGNDNALFSQEDRTRWIKLCTPSIEWVVFEFEVDEESWLNLFIRDHHITDSSTFLSKEALSQYESFVGRPAFGNLLKTHSIISLKQLSTLADRMGMMVKISHLANQGEDALSLYYRYVIKEHYFLLSNRSPFLDCYVNESEAKSIAELFSEDEVLRRRCIAYIATVFNAQDSHLTPYESDQILSMGILGILDFIGGVYEGEEDSSNKKRPIISQELVQRMLDQCIHDLEIIKGLLREAINEMRFLTSIREQPFSNSETPKTKGKTDVELLREEAFFRKHLDSDGSITGQKSDFVAALVEYKFAVPAQGWEVFFSTTHHSNASLCCFDPASNGELEPKLIQLIGSATNAIEWKRYDNIFHKSGKTLSAKDLKKTFSALRDTRKAYILKSLYMIFVGSKK